MLPDFQEYHNENGSVEFCWINKPTVDSFPKPSLQVSATGLLWSQSDWSAELFRWPLISPGKSSRLPAWESDIKHFHQPLDSYVGLSFSQLAVQNTERQVCTFGFKLHIVGRRHLDVGMLYLMLPRDAL